MSAGWRRSMSPRPVHQRRRPGAAWPRRHRRLSGRCAEGQPRCHRPDWLSVPVLADGRYFIGYVSATVNERVDDHAPDRPSPRPSAPPLRPQWSQVREHAATAIGRSRRAAAVRSSGIGRDGGEDRPDRGSGDGGVREDRTPPPGHRRAAQHTPGLWSSWHQPLGLTIVVPEGPEPAQGCSTDGTGALPVPSIPCLAAMTRGLYLGT